MTTAARGRVHALRPARASWEVPLKAVVFDMDGVLVDSEPLHKEACEAMLAAVGIELRRETYLRCVGTTIATTYDVLREDCGLTWSIDEFKARYERVIIARLQQPIERLPGVTELLAMIESRPLALALASSSRRTWIDATLDGLGLTGRFPVTVSGDEVRQGKPSPEIYLLAATRLGLAAGECLAVEDSGVGVTSAHDAGMRTVAVRTEYTRELALEDADIILETLEAFPGEFLD